MPISLGIGFEIGGAGVGRGAPFFVAQVKPGGDYAKLGGIQTFTRADASTCATQADPTGRWTTALANVLRDNHFVGGVRTILLESARQNVVLQSQNISVGGGWAGNSGFETVSTGQADVRGGANASTLTNSNPPQASAAMLRAVALPSTGVYAVSVFAKHGVSASAQIDLNDTTAVKHVLARITAWNDPAAPTVTNAGLDGTIFAYAPPVGVNTFWRIAAVGPALTNTDACNFYCAPSPVAGTGATTFSDPQVEFGAFPTSPIATAAAAATRAVDALTFVGTPAPNPATLYLRWWDLATAAIADSAAAYASGAAITPAVDRAYTDIAILVGTLTAAQCRATLGY